MEESFPLLRKFLVSYLAFIDAVFIHRCSLTPISNTTRLCVTRYEKFLIWAYLRVDVYPISVYSVWIIYAYETSNTRNFSWRIHGIFSNHRPHRGMESVKGKRTCSINNRNTQWRLQEKSVLIFRCVLKRHSQKNNQFFPLAPSAHPHPSELYLEYKFHFFNSSSIRESFACCWWLNMEKWKSFLLLLVVFLS